MIRLLPLLLCALLGGCSKPAPSGGPVVVDDLGRAVEAGKKFNRVVTLAPSLTELVFTLGAHERLVGRLESSRMPAGAVSVASIGGLFPPSMERIIAVQPDLVLMIEGHLKLRLALEAKGIAVYVFQPRTVDAMLSGFMKVGRLLDTHTAAEGLVKGFKARLAALPTPKRRPSVMVEVWDRPLTVAGPDSFVDDVIRRAGGQNAITQGGPWPKLALERLLVADPQIIITQETKQRDAILSGRRPGWASLGAVQKRRVFAPVSPDLIAQSGPRLIEGIEWLSARLGP